MAQDTLIIRLLGESSDLRRELDRVRRELDRLHGTGGNVRGEFNRLNSQSRILSGGMLGLGNAFGGLRGILATLGIASVGHQFVDVSRSLVQLRNGLELANHSAAIGADTFRFLREESNRLGTGYLEAGTAMVRLQAAASETSITLETQRELFTGMASAGAVFGLSTAEVNRALRAFEQIVSKGVVQSEELKLQLGDVLPGAMQLAARAMGVTTAELSKMMERGQVLAEDFIPRIAAVLNETFGPAAQQAAASFVGEIGRLRNAFTDLIDAVGQAGGLDILTSGLRNIREAVEDVSEVINKGIIQDSAFAAFEDWNRVATNALTDIKQGLEGAGVDVDGLVDKFLELADQIPLRDAFVHMATNLDTTIRGAIIGIELLDSYVREFGFEAQKVASQIGTSFAAVGTLIAGVFVNLFGDILKGFQQVIVEIAKKIGELSQSIDADSFFGRFAKEGLQALQRDFITVAQGINTFVEAGENAQATIAELDQKHKRLTESLNDQIQGEQNLRVVLKGEVQDLLAARDAQIKVTEAKITDAQRTRVVTKAAEEMGQAYQLSADLFTESQRKFGIGFGKIIDDLGRVGNSQKEFERGQNLVNEALDAGLITSEQARQELARLNTAYENSSDSKEKAKKSTQKLTEAEKDEKKALNELAKSLADQAKARRAAADSLDEYLKELKEEIRLAGIVDETEQKVARAIAELRDKYKDLGPTALAAAEQVVEGLERQKEATEEQTKLVRELTDTFTTTAADAKRAWISALDSVGDFLADGLVNGFKSAGDTIKQVFKSLLAELIRIAFVNPILLQVGLAGLGGTAAGAAAGAGAGSLFTAQGLTNLISSPFTQSSEFFSNLGLGNTASLAAGGGAAGLGFGALTTLLTGGTGVGNAIGGAIGGAAANAFLSGTLGALAGPFGAIGGGLIGGLLGGLFGGQPSNKAQSGSINLVTEEVIIGGQTGKKFSEENAEARNALLEATSNLAAIVGAFPGASLVGSAGFEVGDRTGLTAVFDVPGARVLEETFASAQEAIKAVFRQIVQSAEGIPDVFKNVFAGFRGTVEELAAGLTALGALNEFLNTDPIIEFERRFAEANRTIFETATNAASQTLRLAQTYDGSISSTIELANSTTTLAQAQQAALAQIEAVSSSVGDTIKNTVRELELSTLTAAERFKFFEAEADQIFKQLLSTVDPQQIQELTASYSQAIRSLASLLSEEERRQAVPIFTQALSSFGEAAQARLDIAQQVVADQADRVQSAIQTAMDRAASAFMAAANEMQGAARTIANTQVNIQVQTTGTSTTTSIV